MRGKTGKPHQFPAYFFRPIDREAAAATWEPPVDIYRTKYGWLLKFELAGIRLPDVNVSVRGCRVIVSGTRRDVEVEDVLGHYSMEISYSSFERTVQLPCDVPNPRVSLDVQNGILIVRLATEERSGQPEGDKK